MKQERMGVRHRYYERIITSTLVPDTRGEEAEIKHIAKKINSSITEIQTDADFSQKIKCLSLDFRKGLEETYKRKYRKTSRDAAIEF